MGQPEQIAKAGNYVDFRLMGGFPISRRSVKNDEVAWGGLGEAPPYPLGTKETCRTRILGIENCARGPGSLLRGLS